MRILVYPHDLDMGGSQTNAIELAAAVTALGHECIVFGQRGTLCDRIEQLGLEFVEAPAPGRRPSRRIARALRALASERDIDVIHGYEWPPALEAAIAANPLPNVAVVATVMSMAVAPFLPTWMPLVVGTQQIAAVEQKRGRRAVTLIEPPVDLAHNVPAPTAAVDEFRARWGLDERPVVACVSRLVPDLKAEGILAAIRLSGELADTAPFQLLVVGDGRARAEMEAAAAAAEARAGRRTVTFTGELADPRTAYSAADVMLAMGGSALRSLAFSKPLVVQGEGGFFKTLSPETLETFLWQGWYGIGNNSADGVERLKEELVPLLVDRELRARLGAFGREVVEQFSLARAATRQLTVYRDAVEARGEQKNRGGAALRAGFGFARYSVGRRVQRLRGTRRVDDFNAVPANDAAANRSPGRVAAGTGPIVYFAGVRWDTLAGTDRQLATEMAADGQILWIDTPRSILRRDPNGIPPVSRPHPNITRLTVTSLPGLQRPGLRSVADWRRASVAKRYLRRHRLHPRAIVASTTAPMLALTKRVPGLKVLFETDDSVAAGAMWGVSKHYLHMAREANLAQADLVLAVTPELARHLQRTARAPRWLPNGVELGRFADASGDRSDDAMLPGPVAGVIGQFNARTDIALLGDVQAAGISLLLVGPRWFTTAEQNAEFEELIARPGVRWVDAVPREQLTQYLSQIDVGLTPYVDSMFNRRSYPLKTLEYLAAGIPVVATDVATTQGLDDRFVSVADRESFVDSVMRALASEWDRAAIAESVVNDGWPARATQVLAWIDSERDAL